ncbi:MAG TPA: cysteine--tRNA ligase [Steroidobacteraceae bacterium]|nr:cysteine--tRNA ligase [Steroidobacteraceae bacterium]
MLQIHNSLTGRKEPFTPLEPGKVRMYVCGITMYDYCHLGHGRMLIVFDVVRRHLIASGYDVTFVRNITDIDDKIIQRSQQNGEPIQALTERFIEAYHEDCRALGVSPGDQEPRATEFVAQIVAMIERLIAKGYAYAADNGDVYYAVARFEPYGRLSGKRLADLRAGARVEVDEAKRDPVDFVLWKAAKPGEPSWESPWGPGRPGWHIECSAMSVAILGPHFDIHGGGMDLKFPHHENEIAQTCAACDSKFVNVWMHNGFVRVDDEKMSKSLGNFFTIREVLEWVRDPEVVRYFIVNSQYRGPINYTPDSLVQADAALERLYLALRGVSSPLPVTEEVARSAGEGSATARFNAAMDDDFNTPVAVAELQALAREINTAKAAGDYERAGRFAAELKVLGARLGLLGLEPEVFLRKVATRRVGVAPEPAKLELKGGEASFVVTEGVALGDADIDRLIDERAAARKAKNFKESDRIRDLLAANGVVLEDMPGGKTLWRRG